VTALLLRGPLRAFHELVRLLPRWYADAGPISIYHSTRALLPAKTRAFVDFIVEALERRRLAQRFAGGIG
jgi:DNA-binding transcriptional LysR family regulator